MTTARTHDPLLSGTKVCPRCSRTLSVIHFAVRAAAPDGLTTYCRECVREYNNEAGQKRRDKRIGFVAKPGRTRPHNYHLYPDVDDSAADSIERAAEVNHLKWARLREDDNDSDTPL